MAFKGLPQQEIEKYMKQPAGKPPHGVIPNRPVPPNTLLPIEHVVTILGLLLATGFVAVRVYTRHFVLKNLGWDDYLSVISWVLLVMLAAAAYMIIRYGGGMHQWDLTYYDLVLLSYWTVFAKAFYILCILVLKSSILLQILRIFVPQRSGNAIMYWTITSLILVNFIFYTIEFFLAIIQCSPRERSWNKKVAGKCIGSSNIVYTAAFNVITDVLIIILPMTRIWRLQMSLRKKIGVSVIFSTGLVAVVTSVLRLYYSYYIGLTKDHSYYYIVLGFCLISECVAGVIVGCMPTVPKFITTAKESWSSSHFRFLSGRSGSERTLSNSRYQRWGNAPKGRAVQLQDRLDELDDVHLTHP